MPIRKASHEEAADVAERLGFKLIRDDALPVAWATDGFSVVYRPAAASPLFAVLAAVDIVKGKRS